MSDPARTMTEDDVKAVVDELERRIVERFFSNVGKGALQIAWQLAWRALIALMVLLAAYGAIKAPH